MQEKEQKRRGNPKFVKGVSGNPAGRAKGVPNKFPSAVREKILHACAQLEAEGKDLGSIASAKPEWFFENFIKVLAPKEVNLRVIQSWQDLNPDERQKLIAEVDTVLEMGHEPVNSG